MMAIKFWPRNKVPSSKYKRILLLTTAFCLPTTAFRLLPTAYCLLPSAYAFRLLPTDSLPTSSRFNRHPQNLAHPHALNLSILSRYYNLIVFNRHPPDSAHVALAASTIEQLQN